MGRARRWLRRAQESWRHRRALRALPLALGSVALAPEVAFYVAIYPPLRDRVRGIWKAGLGRLATMADVPPQTAVYLDRTEAWADGWAGPRLLVPVADGHGRRTVALRGWADLRYMSEPLVLTVRVDGQRVGERPIDQSGDFSVTIPLRVPLPPGLHVVEVQASAWFVPHRFLRNGDFRPLAWRPGEVSLE